MKSLIKIKSVLEDPAASTWVKESLRKAMGRDCVDAAHDANCVAALLNEYVDEVLGRATATTQDISYLD